MAVYVKSILPEKMKIKLVVVEAFDPPAPVTPLTYYMDDTRMDRWVYSTPHRPSPNRHRLCRPCDHKKKAPFKGAFFLGCSVYHAF